MKKTMMKVLYQFSTGLPCLMINTNDLRFVVDEELATINFNTLTVLKMVCQARAQYYLIYCVGKLAQPQLRLSASEPHLTSAASNCKLKESTVSYPGTYINVLSVPL